MPKLWIQLKSFEILLFQTKRFHPVMCKCSALFVWCFVHKSVVQIEFSIVTKTNTDYICSFFSFSCLFGTEAKCRTSNMGSLLNRENVTDFVKKKLINLMRHSSFHPEREGWWQNQMCAACPQPFAYIKS